MDQILTHFHFIRPAWLLLILPGIVLPLLFLRKQSRVNQWNKLIDPNLLPFLIDGKQTKTNQIPIYGLIILWLIASIAMAGPTWKKLPQPVSESVSALVVLWDLSPSMNVADIKPSRLDRSRLKLIDLLNTRKEGLTGLIAYSGEAHVVTPLTDDTKTIISLLPALTPEIMPAMGSNIEMAFEQGIRLLKDSGIDKGDLLVLTDGIAIDAVDALVDLKEKTAHRVTIWGVGSKEGAPIPLSNGGFARDSSNQIIVAKLEERQLSETAIALNGLYVPLSNDDLDIRTITSFNLDADKSSTRETAREFDVWVEYGPYLVLLILPFAAMSFRRGWVIGIVLTTSLLQTHQAEAISWQDLWQTQDQQAQNAMKEGDTETAAKHFKNKDWKAIADYKNQNFEAATEHFKEGETAIDAFNLGNSLAHSGDLDGAIDAYESALAKNPEMQEAKDNLDIVNQLKAMQQNQNQQNQNNQQQEQNQDQSNQNQSQNGESSNSQQSSNQQQESQDGQSNNQQNQDDSQSAQSQESEQSESEKSNQQQALENQYGQQDKPQEEAQAAQEESDQAADEKQAQQLAKPSEEETDNQQEPQQARVTQIGQAKTEEQQALEQWLRKVPDDPSGLMRNKFNFEYRQRKQQSQLPLRRPPSGQSEERW